MPTPTAAVVRGAEAFLKLGATGVVFVLLTVGLLGGGYMLIDRVVDGLEAVVREERAVEVSITELRNAFEHESERADERFDRWSESENRHRADMVRLMRGLAGVQFRTCLNTANGSREGSSACETAIRVVDRMEVP